MDSSNSLLYFFLSVLCNSHTIVLRLIYIKKLENWLQYLNITEILLLFINCKGRTVVSAWVIYICEDTEMYVCMYVCMYIPPLHRPAHLPSNTGTELMRWLAGIQKCSEVLVHI